MSLKSFFWEELQSDFGGSYKPILKPNYEENDDAELSDLENIGRSFDKINQELNLSGPDIRQLYPMALLHKELNIGDVRDLEHKPFKRNADTEPYKVHKQHKKWEKRQSDLSGSYKPILKPNYEENDDELSDLENIGRSFDKINQELNLSGPDIRQLYPMALLHKELNIGDVRDLEHKPFKRKADTEPYKFHKQHKKWIPFFSHKKEASKNVVITKNDNVTAEPKKEEKTKNANFVTSSYTRNKRKIRRSFTDVLCPVCKHRFAVNELETTRDSQDNPIHNSRQYYQRRNTREAHKNDYGDKVMPPILDSLQRLSFKYVDKSPLAALQEINQYQKEEQLREIAEVERKLAASEINSEGDGENRELN